MLRSFRVLAFFLPLFSALSALAQYDVSVTKIGPESAVADTDVLYTITVSNPSQADAPNVALSDTLPGTMTFVQLQQTSGPGFICTPPAVGFGGTVNCSIATLTAGSTATFNLTTHIPPGTPAGTFYDNFANVTDSGGGDTDGTNNTDDTGLTVSPTDDFSAFKDGPFTAVDDSDVTYTVTVANAGPDAGDVTMIDNTPPGMTFVSLTQNNGPTFSCSDPGAGNSGAVQCGLVGMASGASATFTIVMHITSGTVPGTTFNNTATVSTDGFDPNSENNSSTVGTTVASNSADVSVLKNAPSSAAAGSDVAFTVTVTNNGPNDAQTVTLNDPLPGTMTFVSLSQDSGPTFICTTPPGGSGGTVSCTIATLPLNATATFTITANIPGGTPTGTTFNNIATVTSANDPTSENDTAAALVTVSSANLSVMKSGPPTGIAGQTITYAISIANNGPNDAINAHLSDALPANTTLNSFIQNTGPTFTCTTPGAGNNGTVDCTRDVFASGATATFTLVLNIEPIFPDGGTLTNTANIGSDSADPNTSNNSSSTSATITGLTDISVTKNGPATITAGTNITYTISVTNSGVNPALNTTLTDNIPAGTSFVSFTQNSGATFNCTGTTNISCTNAAFAPGTATFTLVVATPASGSGLVSNTANVSTTTLETNSGNNSSTVNTTYTASADVGVTKSGPSTAVQNQDVAYTITVTNSGPSDAQSVSLTDTVPPQASFVSMTQNTGPLFNCSGTTTVTCTIATLTAGSTATFTLTVHTSAAVSGGMLNTANVASTTSDPNPGNNSSSAATNLATADVAVTKNGSPATVAAGSNITWTIVVRNNGPDPATNVTMTDTLPPNTTFVSLNQSGPLFNCSGTTTVTCTIATLASGASTTFTLVAKSSAATPPGTISNTANVSSTSPLDPTPVNNSATSNTGVALVDLSLIKSISAGPYIAGQPVTFTLTVTNSGTVPAENVVVTDVLPLGMNATGFTPPGACTGTTTVTCTAATLGAGASTAFTITATLPPVAGNYTNTASVTSANGETSAANNSGSVGFAVIPGAAIPTLDPAVLLMLAAALGMAALLALRR